VSAAGSDLAVTVNGTTTTRPAPTVKSLDIAAAATDTTALKVDTTAGAIAAPITYDGGATATSTVEVVAPASTWTVSGATGSVAGPLTLSFTNVLAIKATGAGHTLVGPSTNSTWTVNGPGAGTLGTLSYSGFTNLTGAPNNQDTFVFKPGGTLAGTVDGGAGGFDTLVIDGQRGSVVSNPTGPNSGTLVVDGQTITYAGLEPVDISAASVTVNGTSGNETLLVHQHPSDSTKVQVTSSDASFETSNITIAGTTSLTVNGGGGTDTVTVDGNVALPGASVTLQSQTITVASGVTVDTTDRLRSVGHPDRVVHTRLRRTDGAVADQPERGDPAQWFDQPHRDGDGHAGLADRPLHRSQRQLDGHGRGHRRLRPAEQRRHHPRGDVDRHRGDDRERRLVPDRPRLRRRDRRVAGEQHGDEPDLREQRPRRAGRRLASRSAHGDGDEQRRLRRDR